MHHADRDSVRLAAALFIIERGWGKAGQAEHSGKEGETIPRSIQVTFVSPTHGAAESHNTHEVSPDIDAQAWPTR